MTATTATATATATATTAPTPATAPLRRDLALHAARVCTWGALVVGAIVVDVDALVVDVSGRVVDVPAYAGVGLVGAAAVCAATFGFFLAVFSFFHDLAHGALGLGTRTNEWLLALTSVPLWMSAHGQRQHHLRHHARPLADDDFEGAGALMPLWRAVVTGPLASVQMRLAAFHTVPKKVLPWVIGENIANAVTVVVVAIAFVPKLTLAFAVCAALQLTMNAWASHIPHRAPKWLIAAASMLAWTRSPAVLSLVYHLEHHAHPRVPCAQLKPHLETESPLTVHAPERRWAQLAPDRPRPRARRLVGAA